MALAQQIQLQGETGARDRARRVTGSPALRLVGRRLLAAIPVLLGVTLPDLHGHERAAQRTLPRRSSGCTQARRRSPSTTARPGPAVLAAVLALARQRAARKPRHHRRRRRASTTNSPSTCRPPSGCCCTRWWCRWRSAIIVATLAARWPNGIIDRLSLAVSMLGLSIAPYVFAFLLIIVFAVKLNWFPVHLRLPSPEPGSLLIEPDAARLRDRLRAVRDLHPAAAGRHRRADAARGLHRHREGEGRAAVAGPDQARAPELHVQRSSPSSALNLGGLVGAVAIIETIFQLPGHRQRPADRPIQTNDAPLVEGIIAGLRARDVARQPAGRPGLRGTRPKDPVWQLHFLKTTLATPGPRRRCRPSSTPASCAAQRLGRALRLWVPAGDPHRCCSPSASCCRWWSRCPSATNGNIIVDQRAAVLARALARHRPCRASTSSPSSSTAARWRSRSASPSPRIGMVIGGHARARRRLLRRLGGRDHLAAARHPDRLPRPGARAGDRRGARAERDARDRGAVGVQHPGVRPDRARRHADDPRAALHDRPPGCRGTRAWRIIAHATSCRTSCPAS